MSGNRGRRNAGRGSEPVSYTHLNTAACVPMSHAMPESAPAAADDGALVRRSMSGDIRAFELLYRKHVGLSLIHI